MRTIILTNLWFFLAMVFLAFGWFGLREDKTNVIPGFILFAFFMVLAMVTKIGFFANHRGGWPTYVGLGVAFFALYFLGCALGDTFWGTPPDEGGWIVVSFTSVIAVSALLFGAVRHRRAVVLSSETRT
jgi:hypothetical protein